MQWLISGFGAALSPMNLLVALVGCFLGTLVGVLPGLGPTASVALLFPFTAFLSSAQVLIGLGGIYYGAMFGGAITAILLNIPGEVAAVPTAMEGYPLAKQGRGGSTMVICMLSSFSGGIVAMVCLAFFAPKLADLALAFGPFEYLALMLFSLSCAAGLGGGSVAKGLASAFIGLLIAVVGVDLNTNAYRLTFGSNHLLQGFDVVSIVVGLFGITEVLSGILENEAAIGKAKAKFSSLMPNRRELKLGARAAGGGAVIGTTMGMLPGITPSVAAFITYSITKRFAIEKEKFGKGAIEGCAGSEAANNAAAMAGFIPLMALGIPTGPVLAIVLAALIIQGVVPGPLMFTVYRELSGTVIAAFFISNIILLILNIPLSGIWVRIANLPYRWLAPIILFLCVLGGMVVRNSMFDLWVMLFFGLIGFAARKGKFPIPPMVLGIILGNRLETYFRQTAVLGFGYVLTRPFALAITALAVAMVFVFGRYKSKHAGAQGHGESGGGK
jgi:putative tricarboxylic transport membrane protein